MLTDGIWEPIEDLGMRQLHPMRYRRAHVHRCRCRRCGAIKILTESQIAAAKCNGYKSCVNCKGTPESLLVSRCC